MIRGGREMLNEVCKKAARRRAIRLKLNGLSPSDAYSYFCRKIQRMNRESFTDLLTQHKTLYDLIVEYKRWQRWEDVANRPDRDHIITSGGGVHNIDENVKWDISRDSNLASVDCWVVNQIGPSGSLAPDENLILEVRSAGCKLMIHPLSDNCVWLELRRRA